MPPYLRTTRVPRLRLRPIQDADLPFLRDLYGTTRAEELALLDWSEEQRQAFVDQQFGAQHRHYQLAYSDGSFDVVQDAGGAIGRLYVHRAPSEICLMEITLLPERRGEGLGTALTQEVMDEARCDGLPVVLHVESGNPAHRLYERLGFRDEADESFYKRMRWTPGG
jgi:ribosomal protein S18 acetylase RimI-like enzyme